jgi:hypothetical protein
MVTTVSSSFYKAYLAHQELCPISTLRVEGADGRELPFSGFVECSIVLLNDCTKDFEIYVPILVVADTDYNMHVPLVVGTNIIQHLINVLRFTVIHLYMLSTLVMRGD